jgi:hypothetical protein
MVKGVRESISGQEIGGTQERLLTVASFRTWWISKSPAAPGLPGRVQGYPKSRAMSTWMGQATAIPNSKLIRRQKGQNLNAKAQSRKGFLENLARPLQ